MLFGSINNEFCENQLAQVKQGSGIEGIKRHIPYRSETTSMRSKLSPEIHHTTTTKPN